MTDDSYERCQFDCGSCHKTLDDIEYSGDDCQRCGLLCVSCHVNMFVYFKCIFCGDVQSEDVKGIAFRTPCKNTRKCKKGFYTRFVLCDQHINEIQEARGKICGPPPPPSPASPPASSAGGSNKKRVRDEDGASEQKERPAKRARTEETKKPASAAAAAADPTPAFAAAWCLSCGKHQPACFRVMNAAESTVSVCAACLCGQSSSYKPVACDLCRCEIEIGAEFTNKWANWKRDDQRLCLRCSKHVSDVRFGIEDETADCADDVAKLRSKLERERTKRRAMKAALRADVEELKTQLAAAMNKLETM